MNDIINEVKKGMKATIDSLKKELSRVRTGRANTSLVSHIKVEYYGTPTDLNQIANLSVPEPQLIVVQPFDPNSIGEIEKAIRLSDFGFNPINDGKIVRVPIPSLTEDRRKEIVKLVKKSGEDHKVGLRNVRRDGNENLKNAEKKKEITEDDSRKGQDDIQKITDDYVSQIEEIISIKEKEILEI
tara:strand:- start:7443 stop:7997 length:555 start_codon:yes stop_codon:yes gene_type:complete